jgi:hypothetical protein
MPTWLIWALIVAFLDYLIILFFQGADERRDIPDRSRRARTLSWKDRA